MYACLQLGLDTTAYMHTLVTARMHTTTLRAARKRKRLNQEALAELAGVDQATISRLELRRSKRAYAETVEALENALGLKPGTLDIQKIEASA